MAPTNLHTTHAQETFNWVWDDVTQEWVKMTQPGGSGGGAATIADGADVTQGALADAAIVTDVAGTISGKLRGLIKILASVWDSVNGRLKVDGSAVIQPVSGTIAVTSAGLTNLDVALSTRTKPADQQHVIVDSGALTESAATANGTATWTSATALNTAITLASLGYSMAVISLRKTGTITTGAITFEGTYDGTNYLALSFTAGKSLTGVFANPFNFATGGGITPMVEQLDVTGFLSVRIRLSTAIVSTGSIDVRLDITAATNATPLGTVPISGSVDQGNNNATIAQAWKTQVTDGTTGPAKVQPASTAPVATDIALTVALSPNGAIVQANAGTNLNTSALALDATLTGRTAKAQITDGTRDGTVKAASTLPALTDTALVTTQRDPLPAGTNVLGHVISDAGSVATVTQLTLTKGTQGATGVSTQDLKDAGRNMTNFYMVIQIVSTATDALMALTGYKSNALVAATTTPAVVTAGKTYRITHAVMDYISIATTVGSVRFTLRANTGGVVAIGSPVVCTWEVGDAINGAPVAGQRTTIPLDFPDGLEFAAGTGVGISMVGLNTVGAVAIVGYGCIRFTGYEY